MVPHCGNRILNVARRTCGYISERSSGIKERNQGEICRKYPAEMLIVRNGLMLMRIVEKM